MASYLLHGLWLHDSGLNLWIEQVEGHRIVLPSAVPQGTFPPVVERMLEDSMFRHRAKVVMQTPRGKRVSLTIPTAVFGPEKTVRTLAELQALDTDNPVATQAQRSAIAPDLYWIIRMYAGLRKFIKAGRVTIQLSHHDSAWWPQWELASGLGERGWLAEMIAAAPGVLAANNPLLDDDMVRVFTHWIAQLTLKDLYHSPRPYPWHDFAAALLTGSPLRRGGAPLFRALKEWGGSITAVSLELVFIVEQPDDDAEPSEAVWPVRLQVRSGTHAPRPVKVRELDAASVEKLRQSHIKAVKQTSLVDHQLHPMGSTNYRPRFDGSEGDWDAYLKTADILTLITKDAAKLRRAGFAVLLPKAWSQAETSATLHTAPKHDPAESSTFARVGMDTLMNYDWRISIGDTELTEEEMAELVHSTSGLIRLRGEWVMADTSALNKVKKYMEALTRASTERLRADLDRALHDAERAKAAGNTADLERAEEEISQLRNELEKRTREDGTFGEVSLAELRQLALESAVDEPVEFEGASWHEALLGGADTPAPSRVEIPDTVHAHLREYQRRGVDWLYWMSRNGLGAVLADDMGLGKTLQCLALLAVEHARGEAAGPSLVVAPTSVVGNWVREASTFTPSLNVVAHHGPTRLHGEELDNAIATADIIVTSYGMVGRDFKELGTFTFDHVILDEAQAIKNASTKASKSVRSLRSRHRIALSGTPVENRLSEMRSILDFVNPGVLGSASFFRNHFAKAIERENDEVMAQRLRMLTSPFIMRRLKTDPVVIDDLPSKSEQIITVAMTKEQAALYQSLTESVKRELEEREGMARRGLVLATITRIKQICNHPAHYLGDGSSVTERGVHRSGKVAELVKLLDAAVERGERMLIFTQYRAFGDILRPYLTQRLGEDVAFLHGGVSKTGRDRMVEEFQKTDGPSAMILSLKAGGTGLNLTAANVVVHMDRWWNPAVENQATDRAFRIGQDKNVAVYKMITKGTLEESIQDILDGKMQLAGAVIGEGEGWITELDPEQLAQLMSYRGRETETS